MKITIPEHIGDITLRQYQRYHKLTEREDIDEFEKAKRMVEIFCGVKYHDTDKIALNDFKYITELIERAINQDSEFKPRFEMNNVEFGMIPNFDKMTAKEWMDLSLYGLEVDNLHKIMAILFRPIKKSDSFDNYLIHSYDGTNEWADVMLEMPMNVVNGALVFFYNLAKELQEAIQKYTSQVQAKVDRLQTTSKSGDGM